MSEMETTDGEPHYAEITATGSGKGIAVLMEQTAAFYAENDGIRYDFTLVVKEIDGADE